MRLIKVFCGASLLLSCAVSSWAQASDIVSPIVATAMKPAVSVENARDAGRVAYDKPTAENSVMLFIDHQIGLMASTRDFGQASGYRGNVVALAQMAKALGIPVLLTTSNAQWQNGDILPEIKKIFPTEPVFRRTGIINAYEDPTFRAALLELLESTGRTHIIISGVTIGTCVTFPTLSLRNDGYEVFPVVDASGAWSPYEAQAAMSRMSNAGAQLQTVFALGAELQADWKKPSASDMLVPFIEGLPEYGWIVQSYWNNADKQKSVPDPFAKN